MNLGNLNETVILIDTDFLNERIEYNLSLYTKLYPKKNFGKIKLAELLYKFALNARIEEAEHNVDILFAYTLFNSTLTNCEPNNFFDLTDTNKVKMETEIGTFIIRSFFGEEDENCSEHYVNMLRTVNHSPRVSRIIMVSDSLELNYQLEMMHEEGKKSLFLFKKYHESEIGLSIKNINVDYLIAYSLGLKRNEI